MYHCAYRGIWIRKGSCVSFYRNYNMFTIRYFNHYFLILVVLREVPLQWDHVLIQNGQHYSCGWCAVLTGMQRVRHNNSS